MARLLTSWVDMDGRDAAYVRFGPSAEPAGGACFDKWRSIASLPSG